MGVSNKQRRAAKQRKRGASRGRPTAPRRSRDGSSGPASDFDPVFALGHADLLLTAAVHRTIEREPDAGGLREQAEVTMRRLHPVPTRFLVDAADDLLLRLTDTAARGGWGPGDLGELVRRRAGEQHVRTLTGVLREYACREAWTRPAWSGELEELGTATPPPVDTIDGLAATLQVAALLAVVPTLEGPAVTAVASTAGHPKLARVRALLAKAESTEYDEEAEALSAKAQELISRYALERLLDQDHARGREGAPAATARRIWLDAPYVLAKAQFVQEVARANRCRSAVTEALGFCLVVGDSADVDAVELLVTSLLVQAHAAMVRHGRRVDRRGVSRTRSFRQSFLVSYATRIGDRLRAADEDAVRRTGDSHRLLPVLRDQETRVRDAFAAMAPQVVEKATSVTNHEGWAAGRAAADLALLDVHGKISAAEGA